MTMQDYTYPDCGFNVSNTTHLTPQLVQCLTCGNWHDVGPCPLRAWPPQDVTIHWPARVDNSAEILAELRKIRELLEKRT